MKTTTGFAMLLLFIFAVLSTTGGAAETPTPEQVYERVRALRTETKDYQRAADEALAFLQAYEPKDMIRQKIHYEYAAALFQLENFGDAKRAFSSLVADYASTALDKSASDFVVDDALFFAAMIEQTRGDKSKAFEQYKALTENFASSNRRDHALLTLGDLSREAEKWQQSVGFYYRVVAEHPKSAFAPDALFWANRVLIDHVDTAVRARLDPASRDIERVDKQDEIKFNIMVVGQGYAASPKLPEMLQDYMVFLVWRLSPENKEELRSVATHIMAAYAGTPQAEYAREELVDLMILEGSEKEKATAENWLNESIAASLGKGDPEKATNWMYYKAKLYMQQERYEEARQVCDAALASDPETPIAYEFKLKIAMCYRLERNFDEARERLAALAEESADSPQKKSLALFHHAMTYVAEGNLKEAIEHLRPLAEEYPDLNVGEIAKAYIAEYEETLRVRGGDAQ